MEQQVKYPKAQARPTNGVFMRYWVVKGPADQLEFYTGGVLTDANELIHTEDTIWTTDRNAALLYFHFNIACADAAMLQQGDIPYGARGSRHE